MTGDHWGIVGRRVVTPPAGGEDDYPVGGFLATVISIVDEGIAIVEDEGGGIFAVRGERLTPIDPSEDS